MESCVSTTAPAPLRIAIAGLGTVGAGVIRLLDTNAKLIAARAGRPIEVVAVSARDRGKDRGVDIARFAWEDDMSALARRAVAEFGAVHLLCNNAGVGPMAAIADLTPADWTWLIDVNLRGVIHGITHFLPIFRGNADGGHFLNTGSMASLMAVPGLGSYCATKYAVLGLSEVLAKEMAAAGEDIGVTVLCPGPVATDLGSSTRNRPAHLAGGLTHPETSHDGSSYK
jgi:NAD(P)-dependent dehydrogenase (short-subunit alcohol dehydrogenase family)